MITWTASDGEGAVAVVGRVRFAQDVLGGRQGHIDSAAGSEAFQRAFEFALDDPGPHTDPTLPTVRGALDERDAVHVQHAIAHVARAFGWRLRWQVDGPLPAELRPVEIDADATGQRVY